MSEYKRTPEPTFVEAPWLEPAEDPDLHFGSLLKMAFPLAAASPEFKQRLIETSLSILYRGSNEGNLGHPSPHTSPVVNFAPNELRPGEGKGFKRGSKAWQDTSVMEQE